MSALDFSKPYLAVLDDAYALHVRAKPANAPTVISTFAGCGGSSLGYSMAGFRELLAVEWDDNAVACLRANLACPVYHGDIAKLSVSECMSLAGVAVGELDVFDGSPPCQGFSTAGSRNMNDSRNTLFIEFCRLVSGLQPKAFVMENVSGMVKGPAKVLFAEILRALRACGYTVSVKLLNAQWFGVPQSRERLIFIGTRNDLALTPEHPAPLIGSPFTVADAIGDLDDVQDLTRQHTWIEERGNLKSKPWQQAMQARPGEDIRPGGFSVRRRWDRPAPTITKGGLASPHIGNTGAHPKYARSLSGLENKRLCSFPDAYTFVGTHTDIIARVGNCVPPLMMRAVAEQIAVTLGRVSPTAPA